MRVIGILQKGARGNYSGCSAAIGLPLPGNRPALDGDFKQSAATHRRVIEAANRSREGRAQTPPMSAPGWSFIEKDGKKRVLLLEAPSGKLHNPHD
jgi:hypothetical protein